MAEPTKSDKEKIEESAPPLVTQIPFHLVERHSNKTTKLLANSGSATPVEGQNRWYSYDFKEPIFIYRVVINTTGYSDYKLFEVRALDLDGDEFLSSRPSADGKVFLEVNRFCKRVEFRPPKAYFSNTTIQSIEIFGFRLRDAGKFIQFAREIGTIKTDAIAEIEKKEVEYQETISRAEKAEVQRNEALKEVTNLKSAADRQRANIRRLESERTDLTTKISVLDDTLTKNKRERDVLLKELQTKAGQKEQLDAQITKMTSQLSELKANIDLFPSELDSFVKQGARNNKTLFYLALAPILVICAMFVLLISGAVDLTTKITVEQNINLTALIVSRAPYVIVSIAIITACYKIARAFMSEMIQVNRQRLNLTKVSIIAKDVSTAAEQGLDLSEADRYNLRVRLKMEILKDHLKGYISPKFEALPTRITGHFPFLPFGNKPVDTKQEGVPPADPDDDQAARD